MGQKINPIGFRLGINRTWDSRWYANTGEYAKLLHEDIKIREYLEKELKQAAISKVVIERPHKKCRVTIHAARPGLIIDPFLQRARQFKRPGLGRLCEHGDVGHVGQVPWLFQAHSL